jgi:hypothetical protein
MPQPLFDVFFRGALVADADPGEVRDRLAALFGLGPGELDRLFAGATVCVKRAVDVETASQLRGRFRDAGALVDIRPAETAAKAPPPAPAALAAAPARPEPAPAGAAGLTLAPPRTGSLADYARPAVPAPLPDLSRLDLAPAGPNLGDAAAPPPPAIDTSHLSVAPPNTGSLEDCRQEKPARPIGDISHLRLTDD